MDLKAQVEIIKKVLADKELTQKINAHVNECQICNTGDFCNKLTKLLNDAESKSTK